MKPKAEDFIRARSDFIVQSTISLTIFKTYDIIIERGDCYGRKQTR